MVQSDWNQGHSKLAHLKPLSHVTYCTFKGKMTEMYFLCSKVKLTAVFKIFCFYPECCTVWLEERWSYTEMDRAWERSDQGKKIKTVLRNLSHSKLSRQCIVIVRGSEWSLKMKIWQNKATFWNLFIFLSCLEVWYFLFFFSPSCSLGFSHNFEQSSNPDFAWGLLHLGGSAVIYSSLLYNIFVHIPCFTKLPSISLTPLGNENCIIKSRSQFFVS